MFLIIYIYILCQKKNEKKNIKKSFPPVKTAGTEKKNQKKNRPISQPVADCHVSGVGLFPPFETAGMGKRTKKKIPKMKVGHFGKFFSKGVRLEIFLGNRVGKKKNSFYHPPSYPYRYNH